MIFKQWLPFQWILIWLEASLTPLRAMPCGLFWSLWVSSSSFQVLMMSWFIISDFEFSIFESIPPLFYHGQQQQKWWGVNIFIKGGWLSPDCDAQQFTTYTVSKEKSRKNIVEGNGPAIKLNKPLMSFSGWDLPQNKLGDGELPSEKFSTIKDNSLITLQQRWLT